MKKLKLLIILGIILLLFWLLINNWNSPKSISHTKIDWKAMDTTDDGFLVSYIYVYEENNDNPLFIQSYIRRFAKIIEKNPELVFSNYKEGLIKVFIKFEDVKLIDIVYGTKKYDNQQSTFYIDKSLLEDIIKISDGYLKDMKD